MDQCCGNCGLGDETGCNWVDEYIRSDGRLPFWVIVQLYDTGYTDPTEGTDCETWQKREG